MNNFRFAVRSLINAPTFSLAVILTLAIGIGATSAIFSVVDRILFRPPPYSHPEQLYEVGFKTSRIDFQYYVSPLEYLAYRERTDLFRGLCAFRSSFVNLVSGTQAMGVNAGAVTPEYFGNFGATATLGRLFVPGENQPGSEQVVVLSHRLWRTRFNSDPQIVDRSVLLDGASCRVVGVLSADAIVPNPADTFQPLQVVADSAHPFGQSSIRVIGRLREDVTIDQVIAALSTIKYDVGARYARVFADRKLRLRSVLDDYRAGGKQAQWTLLAGVGFLYAIACSNALNLLLARVHSRRKELSVRLAVGCSPARLVGLIATESLLLTGAAGLLGLVVARWVFPVLLWLASRTGIGFAEASTLDWRAIAFTVGLSILTGAIICAGPAWRLGRVDVTIGLKDGGPTADGSRRRHTFRSGLVIVEAALAVVLLIGTGLMARTVFQLQHFDRGVDPTDKAAVSLIIPQRVAATPEATRALFLEIVAKLKTVPGVKAVSLADYIPFSQFSNSTTVRTEDGTEHFTGFNQVSPSYRRLLGLPLVRGSWFDDARPGAAPVVVLNETLANLLFAEENPVGRPFVLDPRSKMPPWQIIGVVRDIREPHAKASPMFYFPDTQAPPWNSARTFAAVLLRLGKPADAAMETSIQRAMYAVSPLIATMKLEPLSESVAQRMNRERYALTVLKVLSFLALGLAIVGLFAVMAYNVAQRMNEFGVRLALGAVPRQLFHLVLARGAALVMVGIASGAVLAGCLTRLIRSLLFETSPTEPVVYLAVAVVLLLAAVLGCWVPARRAMRVDVATLLRTE